MSVLNQVQVLTHPDVVQLAIACPDLIVPMVHKMLNQGHSIDYVIELLSCSEVLLPMVHRMRNRGYSVAQVIDAVVFNDKANHSPLVRDHWETLNTLSATDLGAVTNE